ncbi:DNA primase [Sphingomonas sp.]|uniref:DNA primase n=1 Tax=Sphingomonas sp. TaxID=28214 RepID=UPI001DE04EB8|nr:DNA primase [Sphingomonas sp.]MBX9796116.1 DNA primase [Sphingomonas sp.]
MTLSPQFLDELRARTTLSTLIAKSVKLTKAGREFKGCCPFHQEKTPSFYVNDDKGFYHCFGCTAHGDAIRWMTDQRGLPFMDAVKELAQAAGMEVPAPDPRAAAGAERARGLHEAMADAAAWFTEQLNGIEGGEARALLERRGVNAETARSFGLGYAPDARGRLRAALARYGDAVLVEAGLLIQVEDKEPYDRFRGRLMIPIRDARGRVIAFGGRVIGTGEPKYLNSPDTPLFDKGRTLYNLDRAAPAARKAGRLIVVEGYMDVIALAQAGIAEAVAPLGTALTAEQLDLLWRQVEVPLLCFDGDSAGQKAAIRAAQRAVPRLEPGKSLSFVGLPQGKDPDDLLREAGPAAFEAATEARRPLIQILYEAERAQTRTETPEGRAALRQRINALAEEIGNGLVKYEYRRAFNDLFFEEFGWKRAERRVIGQAAVASGPHGPRDLYHSFTRSALFGLSRYPQVLNVVLEPISLLPIRHELLLPWRETLVEAVIKRPGLDEDAIQSILTANRLKPQSRADLCADLRFRWDAEPASAVRALGGLVEYLVEEQEILAELEELTARITADTALEHYEALEQARAALRARQSALYETAYLAGLADGETE